MSIQRYDILHPKMRDKGRFVLYADHIADKAADLHHLLSTLADIRRESGVGDKPMLSELAGEIGKIKTERDAALARAERAETDAGKFCAEAVRAEDALRHLYDLHSHGVFRLPDEHYAAITNAAAVLSSPPADASTMGGERCDTCPHDPDTCDRAECPAWGKSEETKALILTREANRPLTDEEYAIVDAGYERGKRILIEVKAEEREMQYMEALAAYATDEDRYNRGEGEPYGSIQVEVGVIARQARAALAEMEQKS